MRGSMRERSPGVWELIVQLPRDVVTGKPKQLSRSVRGTKREAQRRLAALVNEVSNSAVPTTSATLHELIDQWLSMSAERLSPTTAREYRRLATVMIDPALGTTLVRKLTPQRLDEFYAVLGRERSLSASSVRQVHAVIRGSLNQAVKWGWLMTNPARSASPPKLRRHEITPPDVSTTLQLLAAADADDPDFGALLRVSAATGARRGEICALRWSDVDLSARILIIHRSVAVVPDQLIEKDTKTHAARRIAIDDHTVAVLAGHRTRLQVRAAFAEVALAGDGYVFSPSADGSTPLSPTLVTGRFRRLCRRLGVTGVRLHDLRHLHATQLLAAGVPVRTVSGRLGHADAATTLNVYAHFLEASDRQAADVIAGLLTPES